MPDDGDSRLRTPTKEERQLFLAQAADALASAEKLKAEAEKARSDAAMAAVSQRREERLEREALTANKYHRVYHFTSAVGETSVRTCMDQLNIWHRLEPGESIEIIFTSPGGAIIDGMALFDYIQTLRRDGHRITTGALGMAASMAGILLQAGELRWISREGWLLIHEASFGAIGTYGQVEDQVTWVKRIQERILDIFADRAKVSRAFIKRNWHRKDWWLSSTECLKHGFVDEVR